MNGVLPVCRQDLAYGVGAQGQLWPHLLSLGLSPGLCSGSEACTRSYPVHGVCLGADWSHVASPLQHVRSCYPAYVAHHGSKNLAAVARLNVTACGAASSYHCRCFPVIKYPNTWGTPWARWLLCRTDLTHRLFLEHYCVKLTMHWIDVKQFQSHNEKSCTKKHGLGFNAV